MTSRVLAGLVVAGLLGCSSGSDGTADAVPSTGAPVDDSVVERAADRSDVDGLMLDVEVDRTAADVATAPMSDDHLSTVVQLGPPDRFVLRFDGNVRRETWHYDTADLDVVFRDGVRLYVEPVGSISFDGLGTTPYEPNQFTGGMSLDDLLAVTGEHGYAEQPLDLVDGRLIVLEGIVAGFDDDGLRYLETIPIDLD